MGIWIPDFPARLLPAILRITCWGTLLAGVYGALHDQISFTISPEYFTQFKFRQFAWADCGLPPRLFAAEIGFLATWWVGLIGGWLLARLGLAELSGSGRNAAVLRAFGIVAIVAAVAGVVGVILGIIFTQEHWLDQWRHRLDNPPLDDLRGFVIVAFLHWASYLGGLLGVLRAVVYVKRRMKGIR